MIRRKNSMSKEKFVRILSRRGYKPSQDYSLPNKPEFSIWEKPNSNIIIEVRTRTFARVIKFLDGRFGYVEALPFNKNSCI